MPLILKPDCASPSRYSPWHCLQVAERVAGSHLRRHARRPLPPQRPRRRSAVLRLTPPASPRRPSSERPRTLRCRQRPPAAAFAGATASAATPALRAFCSFAVRLHRRLHLRRIVRRSERSLRLQPVSCTDQQPQNQNSTETSHTDPSLTTGSADQTARFELPPRRAGQGRDYSRMQVSCVLNSTGQP